MYKAISRVGRVREAQRKITDSDNVAELVRETIGEDIGTQEHFVLITLNGSSEVIRAESVFIGTLNQSLVHPREIFRRALLDNAAAIIISHNHPSGQLEASIEDKRITKRLKEVGTLMGIELLDHIIVTENGYLSLRENGIL